MMRIILIGIILEQGLVVLAIGADEGCLDIFILPIRTLFFLPFSLRSLVRD